jgi:hypothetical protein
MDSLAFATKSIWHDFSKGQFKLYKNDTDFVILGPGDTITWDQRTTHVKIVRVSGSETATGPIGFSYLPFRNGKWEQPQISIARGDPRFIICYPEGFPHYGLHITLHTIKKDGVPELNESLSGPVYKSSEPLVYIRYQIFTITHIASLDSVYSINTPDLTYDIRLFRHMDQYVIHLHYIDGSNEKMEEIIRQFETLF